ncbi:MAG: BrnA antitoxin family protein [Sulfuritalea sp.]|nr:BrnA antitoxin family protein [Sulfuritalea sp.]
MKKKSTTPILDDDTPITQADIDSGKLILRKRSAGRVVLPKKRVTLYLDAALVEHFKHMAGERGYQTLINETLKSSVQTADIAETVRRVIREELKGRKAA